MRARALHPLRCPAHQRACARRRKLYEEFYKVATEEQQSRFEQYKRSKFPRAAMRRLMSDVVGISSERCAIVLASLAKTLVGELVESAREQMTNSGQSGPIQPYHLRSAHRRAQQSGSIPAGSHRPRKFARLDCGP